MKFKRFIAAVLCLCLMLALPLGTAAEEPEKVVPELKSAQSALLGDMSNGKIIYSRDAFSRREPASLTKMMTLLIAVEAIENGDAALDDMVTASADCKTGLDDTSSSLNINLGETMSLQDLLYCAALASANEACNIIAEHISGSVDAFVKRMNERAAELDCSGTHFANTHGMPDSEHYTTARDLFVIACEGMRHPLFAQIVGTAQYTTAATNVNAPRTLKSSNALITRDGPYSDKYYYDSAVGIKTGHTQSAGYCLAGAVQRDGINIISIVLGASGNPDSREFDSFGDTIALYDWCFANCSYRSIIKKGDAAAEQPLMVDGVKGTATLYCDESINALAENSLDISTLKKTVTLMYDTLDHKPEKGEELGQVSFTDPDDGTVYGTVTLVSDGSAEFEQPPTQSPADKQLTDSQKEAITIVCAIAIFLILLFAVLFARRSRRRKAAKRKPANSRRR